MDNRGRIRADDEPLDIDSLVLVSKAGTAAVLKEDSVWLGREERVSPVFCVSVNDGAVEASCAGAVEDAEAEAEADTSESESRGGEDGMGGMCTAPTKGGTAGDKL